MQEIEKVKMAYESFRENRDSDELLKVILEIPQGLPKGFEYPEIHRIEDIELGDSSYRVNRLRHRREEKIYIVQCSTPSKEAAGVPYELSGRQLDAWIEEEKEEESDGPTDWSRYFNLDEGKHIQSR